MKIAGQHYRTIWLDEADAGRVCIIDQRRLPHAFTIVGLHTLEDAARAIRDMQVRGAGLIGAAAGYGMYLAALQAPHMGRNDFLETLRRAGETLKATRPTAVNLAWAVERQLGAAQTAATPEEITNTLKTTAQNIADQDAEFCRRIGGHGLEIIPQIAAKKPGQTVNILTHCNAGWLAFVDYGSATAPIYAAHDAGVPVHVWVDETRPRNQGSSLTAWELAEHGVPHTVVVDNAGGHLMQRGLVDMVIVGSDRTSFTGDVGNKIGTYLKALAAADNRVPFYAALPSSTLDWSLEDGVRDTPIEERDPREVTHIGGVTDEGVYTEVRLTPQASPAKNYGFDVTPRRLVTGLITERGVCAASAAGVFSLYPEREPSRAV
ncbi:S-methyl-5-thioribose-1-phosphate isomerase [soil metagenome]